MKKSKATLTLADINWLLDSFKEVFVTKHEFKKYTGKVLDTLDTFIGDIKTKREEQILHDTGHQRIDKRLTRLEKHANLQPAAD